jgi:hypothetical protein
MPLASTMTPIATNTLTSATTSVAFTGIPNIYTDIVAVCQLVATSGTLQNAPQLRFNSDTGSNYSALALNGNGTSAASSKWSNQTVIYADYFGILQNDGIGQATINIMNYANTTINKSVLIRSGKGNKETTATVGLWRNTAAIHTVTFITDSPQTFAAGTTFTIYGVKAA